MIVYVLYKQHQLLTKLIMFCDRQSPPDITGLIGLKACRVAAFVGIRLLWECIISSFEFLETCSVR